MLWSRRRAHRKHSKQTRRRRRRRLTERDGGGKKNNNIVSLNKQSANCLKISSNKTQYVSWMLPLLLRESFSLSLSVARLTNYVGNAHAHHKPPGDCQDRVGVGKRKEEKRKRKRKRERRKEKKRQTIKMVT